MSIMSTTAAEETQGIVLGWCYIQCNFSLRRLWDGGHLAAPFSILDGLKCSQVRSWLTDWVHGFLWDARSTHNKFGIAPFSLLALGGLKIAPSFGTQLVILVDRLFVLEQSTNRNSRTICSGLGENRGFVRGSVRELRIDSRSADLGFSALGAPPRRFRSYDEAGEAQDPKYDLLRTHIHLPHIEQIAF